jgi:hypothetical protein
VSCKPKFPGRHYVNLNSALCPLPRKSPQAVPYLLSNTQTSWLTQLDTPNTATAMTIREEDAKLFEDFIQGKTFSLSCSCSACSPRRYQYPGYCQLPEFPTDLTIEDGQGPATKGTNQNATTRFEALRLMTVACQSLTRSPEKMSVDQKDALRQ